MNAPELNYPDKGKGLSPTNVSDLASRNIFWACLLVEAHCRFWVGEQGNQDNHPCCEFPHLETPPLFLSTLLAGVDPAGRR